MYVFSLDKNNSQKKKQNEIHHFYANKHNVTILYFGLYTSISLHH